MQAGQLPRPSRFPQRLFDHTLSKSKDRLRQRKFREVFRISPAVDWLHQTTATLRRVLRYSRIILPASCRPCRSTRQERSLPSCLSWYFEAKRLSPCLPVARRRRRPFSVSSQAVCGSRALQSHVRRASKALHHQTVPPTLYRPLVIVARASRLVSELLLQEAIDVPVCLRRGGGAVFEPMTEVDRPRLCRGDIEVMESPRVNNEPNL